MSGRVWVMSGSCQVMLWSFQGDFKSCWDYVRVMTGSFLLGVISLSNLLVILRLKGFQSCWFSCRVHKKAREEFKVRYILKNMYNKTSTGQPLVWWRLWNFSWDQMKFNTFSNPNKHTQRIFLISCNTVWLWIIKNRAFSKF